MTLPTTKFDSVDETETSPLLSGKTSVSPPRENSCGPTPSDCENGEVEVPPPPQPRLYSSAFIGKVVVALLIGVFTSNADSSLVLATHPVIASEFNTLGDSSWLFISFLLAGATTQALYGKLSDIFGRKSTLIVCYALFAIGCGFVGGGQSMWQVILGRVVSGSGGAGMTVLASVIITDLAPIRDVASWQSYMNVIATVGRSLGGPLGGWLADTIGWRWSFLGQSPTFLVAALLCWGLLPSTSVSAMKSDKTTFRARLGRIDGLGAILLGGGLLAFMLPLEIGGQKVPWNHPLVFSLLGMGVVLLYLFVLVESRWAAEPILPLRLFRERNVTLSFVIMAAQSAAQLGMMFAVPLYFQVTQRASSTVAGAHLFPAVIGNTVGGIASGLLIHRTGRYKGLVVFAAISSILCYTLMFLRWHGETGWAESLYVFPGGLGTGIAQSAVFIALQASIIPEDKAAAISGLFLCFPVGAIIGMAGSSAIMLGILKRFVQHELTRLGIDDTAIAEVLRKSTENVNFIDHAPSKISRILVEGYVKGIEYSHGLSILFSAIALFGALLLRERAL
ncbi:Fc.00g045820.m01.CDS01 [Cosmosporella sp. VM-42]